MFSTIEEQIEYWDNARPALVGPRDEKDIGMRIRSFVEHITRPMGRVLDFGCGLGRLYGGLQPFDYYVGVDISNSYLQRFRRKYPDVPLVRIKDLVVPFIHDEFNTILCYSVFTHLPREHIEILLPQFHRVLKPKGVAIISIFERAHVGRQYYSNWITHEREWFLDVCEKNKFRLVKEGKVPEYPMPHHQTLFMLEARK